MRECVNCEHSRGLGSDVWCSKGFETSYMNETDCCHFKGCVGSEKYTNRGSTVYENNEELSIIDIVDVLNEFSAKLKELQQENKNLIMRIHLFENITSEYFVKLKKANTVEVTEYGKR